MVELPLDPWATVMLVALRVNVPVEEVVVDPPVVTARAPMEPA